MGIEYKHKICSCEKGGECTGLETIKNGAVVNTNCSCCDTTAVTTVPTPEKCICPNGAICISKDNNNCDCCEDFIGIAKGYEGSIDLASALDINGEYVPVDKKDYTIVVKIKNPNLGSTELYGSVMCVAHPRGFNYKGNVEYDKEFLDLNEKVRLLGKNSVHLPTVKITNSVNSCFSYGQEDASSKLDAIKTANDSVWYEIGRNKLRLCAPYKLSGEELLRSYVSLDITWRIWDANGSTFYPSGHTLSNSGIAALDSIGASFRIEVYSNPQLTELLHFTEIDSDLNVKGNNKAKSTKYNDSIMVPIFTQGRTIYGQWEVRDIILNN
jgi:hypothetical protein